MGIAQRIAGGMAATALALALLLAAACRPPPADPTGEWEGTAGECQLSLQLHEDGVASLVVTVDGKTHTTHCRWARLNERICLTNSRGQAHWLTIVECERNELTLRLGPGAAGLGRFHRAGTE
ncbi:MAG TPA: hypothetical protein VHE13_05605 [Opitutus sp.]|nr:hypothetical protein [Opitutus sp.]